MMINCYDVALCTVVSIVFLVFLLVLYRKRQRAEGDDEDIQMPQAKRLSSNIKSSETARESWESEVTNTSSICFV